MSDFFYLFFIYFLFILIIVFLIMFSIRELKTVIHNRGKVLWGVERMKYKIRIEIESNEKLTQDDAEILISQLHTLGYKTGDLKVISEELK